MSIEKESPLYKKSQFDELLKSKVAAGWYYKGMEKLTQTKFSKDAKFEEVPYQTEDAIKEKYRQIVKQEDPSSEFEVDLVLDQNTQKLLGLRRISTEEEYRNFVSNLMEKDKNYFVFVKKIKK